MNSEPAITRAEIATAITAALAAERTRKAGPQPAGSKWLSRKLAVTLLYEFGVLATTAAGGLPHAMAGIVSAIGLGCYLLAQGYADAATPLPPAG